MQPTKQPYLLPLPAERAQVINEANLPYADRPAHRLADLGPRALSTVELLAILIGGSNALNTAYEVLAIHQEGELARASLHNLARIKGIGESTAARIVAALDLGRRALQARPPERPRITTPADAANLLMGEMQSLEQEHIRVILLNTRNYVIGIPTIYVGSLNTSVVRIAEIFRRAVDANAAALILVHNHPTGDASPSPEDVAVTRQVVEAGKMMSIDVLDHLVIGRNQFVSLKERGLGFS